MPSRRLTAQSSFSVIISRMVRSVSTMPVRSPLMLMMAPPICSSVPPISQTMVAEAAVAAETPQPQVADSFPVKSLM